RPGRRRLPAAHLAGEQAAREREVRDQTEPELLERRYELGLRVAREQRVLVLGRDEPGEAALPRERVRVAHLLRGEVRRADVAHLAGANELVEGPERLLERRDAVGAVVLVEVDVVDAQPLERAVDRGAHVLCRAPAGDPPAELRRDHGPVAPPGERTAEQALALPVPVALRRVEERHPGAERGVDDRARAGPVDAAAEHVAAEPDGRDDEVRGAEPPFPHARAPPRGRGRRPSPPHPRRPICHSHPVQATPLRVVVAEDDDRLAGLITSLLAADGRFAVAGRARTGDEAVALSGEERPDIVLMDLAMPGCDGVEATRMIRDLNPAQHVVVYTGSADYDDVRRAERAGAAGFLHKDALSTGDLADALDVLHRNFRR